LPRKAPLECYLFGQGLDIAFREFFEGPIALFFLALPGLLDQEGGVLANRMLFFGSVGPHGESSLD
jgi:hypothetical protein